MALVLPRFQQSAALVDQNGLPTIAFHIWWDNFAKNLEQAFNDLADNVAAIAAAQATADQAIADAAAAAADAAAAAQDALDAANQALAAQATADDAIADAAAAAADAAAAAQDALDAANQALDAQNAADAAQSTANTANSTANTANNTANTVKRDDSISTSWTSPGTILSATDAGSNATINISAHTRKYTDVSSASVNSGSITALSYSTTYYVYYDQTSRAGGAVTYQATTNPNTALPNAAAGRHYCGKVTTPAAGGGGTSGGVAPPGAGGGVGGGDIP